MNFGWEKKTKTKYQLQKSLTLRETLPVINEK